MNEEDDDDDLSESSDLNMDDIYKSSGIGQTNINQSANIIKANKEQEDIKSFLNQAANTVQYSLDFLAIQSKQLEVHRRSAIRVRLR